MSMSTKKTHKCDDAVSPVVGVMLMLVTTILIASLVAALASDVSSDIEKSSTAVLDVQIESCVTEDGGGMLFMSPKFSLIYLSGDTKLDTSKMKIVSSWVDEDGNSHTHTYTAADSEPCTLMSGSQLPALYVRTHETMGWYTYDLFNEVMFGNVVLTSGNKLVSPVDMDMMNYGCPVSIGDYTPFEQIFGDGYDTIEKGSQISISVIYEKHAIFEKVVTVE